jgi:hypothetical protein
MLTTAAFAGIDMNKDIVNSKATANSILVFSIDIFHSPFFGEPLFCQSVDICFFPRAIFLTVSPDIILDFPFAIQPHGCVSESELLSLT